MSKRSSGIGYNSEIGMNISILKSYFIQKPLSLSEFENNYNNQKEYYFIAYK
ncbi:MAG: hypothetical protein AB7S54_03545 [Bacteroidales bacterium]